MKGKTCIFIGLVLVMFCFVMPTSAMQINIPTYDGSGQAAHPDIYYNESGLFGFKYWMAFTPYFESRESLENPCLIASTDGVNWVVPDGVTNPIDSAPADGHNSDTDLVYDPDANELRIYYRWNNATASSYHVRTYDGVSISDEIEVQTTMYGLSPAFLRNDDGTYNMWVVASGESPNGVYKLTSSDGLNFTNAESVAVVDSVTADVWHIDVVKSGSTYYGIICYCDLSTSGANAVLRLGMSTDNGETFSVQTDPIIPKGTEAWNNNVVYRGTGIVDSDGLVIWYSAEGYPPACWGVGIDRIAYIDGKWIIVDYYGHTDENSNHLDYSVSTKLPLKYNYNSSDIRGLSVSVDPLHTQSIYDRVSTDGLLAWYKYDNSDGTTVLDSSINGNNASKDSAFAYTTDGKYGNASLVVGSSGIAYKTNFNLSSSSFTVSLHSKSNENVTNPDGWIGQGSQGDCWAIGSYNGRIFASINGANDGQYVYGPSVVVGEQAGITVTFDAIDETHTKITFYKNGKLTGYGIVNQVFNPTAKTLRLGRSDIGAPWSATNVTIDNVLLYNRVLTPSEAAEIYYDPVDSLTFSTNSNLTQSDQLVGQGVVSITYGDFDDDVVYLSANVPDETTLDGVIVHDYPNSLTPATVVITVGQSDFSTITTTGFAPATFTFYDNSASNTETWAWDFENDGTIDSTKQNPVHTYGKAGTYTVNLTVQNEYGNFSTVKTDYITVSAPAFASDPVAWFNWVFSYLSSMYVSIWVTA